MRLYAKAIIAYNTINSFKYGNQWTIRSEEPNTLYFQIVDLDQDSLRYIGSNAIVTVTFPSIDDDAEIEVTASLVNAADGSLFKIELTDEQTPASGNVRFAVEEGSITRRFTALAMMSVETTNENGSC